MVSPHLVTSDTDIDLRVSEERLRLATEAAQIGTYDWDLVTGKAICSETLEQICGLTGAFVDSNPEALAQLVHPDDRASVEQTIDACLRQDRQPDIEFRIVTPDGSLKWIAGKARALR